MRERLTRLADQDRARRPKEAVDENLLMYAGLPELRTIGMRHWECCVRQLTQWPSKNDLERELNRLNTIRDPGQHARQLQPHELMEGEGIARRLTVTSHVSQPVDDEPHWPVITGVEDSLGNNVIVATKRFASLRGAQPIRAGDRLRLTVRAMDPKNRPLQYRLIDFDNDIRLPWQGEPSFSVV